MTFFSLGMSNKITLIPPEGRFSSSASHPAAGWRFLILLTPKWIPPQSSSDVCVYLQQLGIRNGSLTGLLCR